MAKKTRPKSRAKVKAKPYAKTAAQLNPPQTPEVTPQAEPQADSLVPQSTAPQTSFILLPLAAWVAGLVVVGVIWTMVGGQEKATPTEVKNQTIPMSFDDFSDDPALQRVIQKQLGQETQPPSPQTQPDQSPQSTGGQLQRTGSDLQPQ